MIVCLKYVFSHFIIFILQGLKPFEFRIVTENYPVLRARVEPENFIHFQDESLSTEYKDLLELVQSHLKDDVERINSNLRYVLNKREKNL
jgi:hypothetical protein